MNKEYVKGFMDKCASLGVDAERLVEGLGVAIGAEILNLSLGVEPR